MGLVNHVVTHGELLPFSRELALGAGQNDQLAVCPMMRTYDESDESIHDAA